jgi:ABC-type polysaccharide/polyol phosphate export permease
LHLGRRDHIERAMLDSSMSASLSHLRADFSEIVREQLEFRELFFQMTSRDLRLRYKQTLMGFGWALFAPLLNTVVFSIIFTRVAPVQTPVPYPLFAYCGFLAWNLTASALRFAVSSLTANTTLVTKVYFPREIFPFSSVAVSLVDFAVGSVMLAALMAFYRVVPGPALLWLPAVLAVQVAFTMALALLLSMSNAFFRDVKYLFEAALTIWMFASAVVYPLDSLRGGWSGLLLRMNPMTAIIDAYRSVVLLGTAPEGLPFAAVAVLGAVLLPVSWLLFHRLEFQFAENV